MKNNLIKKYIKIQTHRQIILSIINYHKNKCLRSIREIENKI